MQVLHCLILQLIHTFNLLLDQEFAVFLVGF